MMTPEEKDLNEILKRYLPDRYWQHVRKMLIPPLIEWKKQKKPAVKKEIEPHTCHYKEIRGKFRCVICKETIGTWLQSEIKKNEK